MRGATYLCRPEVAQAAARCARNYRAARDGDRLEAASSGQGGAALARGATCRRCSLLLSCHRQQRGFGRTHAIAAVQHTTTHAKGAGRSAARACGAARGEHTQTARNAHDCVTYSTPAFQLPKTCATSGVGLIAPWRLSFHPRGVEHHRPAAPLGAAAGAPRRHPIDLCSAAPPSTGAAAAKTHPFSNPFH